MSLTITAHFSSSLFFRICCKSVVLPEKEYAWDENPNKKIHVCASADSGDSLNRLASCCGTIKGHWDLSCEGGQTSFTLAMLLRIYLKVAQGTEPTWVHLAEALQVCTKKKMHLEILSAKSYLLPGSQTIRWQGACIFGQLKTDFLSRHPSLHTGLRLEKLWHFLKNLRSLHT